MVAKICSQEVLDVKGILRTHRKQKMHFNFCPRARAEGRKDTCCCPAFLRPWLRGTREPAGRYASHIPSATAATLHIPNQSQGDGQTMNAHNPFSTINQPSPSLARNPPLSKFSSSLFTLQLRVASPRRVFLLLPCRAHGFSLSLLAACTQTAGGPPERQDPPYRLLNAESLKLKSSTRPRRPRLRHQLHRALPSMHTPHSAETWRRVKRETKKNAMAQSLPHPPYLPRRRFFGRWGGRS